MNWVQQTSGTTENLVGVSFTSADEGTVVGINGTILRTTDSGTNWAAQTSGTAEWLLGVSFVNSTYGDAVGTSGANLMTSDGGATWEQQTNMTGTFYDVSFTDASTGTVVGENGTILRLGIPTGIQDNNLDKFYHDFSLAQNYPNPFNPSTKISWQSPEDGWQSLKIFDVLGRQVETLVNEYKPAGNYEIDFNAENLSSGIYFYKIESGRYTAVRKNDPDEMTSFFR